MIFFIGEPGLVVLVIEGDQVEAELLSVVGEEADGPDVLSAFADLDHHRLAVVEHDRFALEQIGELGGREHHIEAGKGRGQSLGQLG